MIIAKITIPKPATNPVPTFARCKADSTSLPRPGAPIMEAITTMDKASITVWLIPAIIVSLAIGNSTLNSFWAPVLPNASEASINSSETCLIPKLVNRTVGGVANINEANTPGTIPIPKNATAGIKYTNAGIVCIKSRMGVIIASATLLLDINMPIGTPITIDRRLATNTNVNVSIKCSQYPWLLISQRPNTENAASPNRFPDRKKAINATMIIIINGGIAINVSEVKSIKLPKYSFIGSNKNANLSVN